MVKLAEKLGLTLEDSDSILPDGGTLLPGTIKAVPANEAASRSTQARKWRLPFRRQKCAPSVRTVRTREREGAGDE